MRNRIEKAIANLFKIEMLRQQIAILREDTDDLLLVSEVKEPERVRAVDLSVLAELGVCVIPADYVGHKARMGDVEACLHTLANSGTVRHDPRDKIFSTVYKQFGTGKP